MYFTFLGYQFPALAISKSQFYFFYYSSNILLHFQLAFGIIYKSNPMWPAPWLVYSTNLQRHHFEDAVHYRTTLNRWNLFSSVALGRNQLCANCPLILFCRYIIGTITNHNIHTHSKTKSRSKWRHHVAAGSRLCCRANSYLSPTTHTI